MLLAAVKEEVEKNSLRKHTALAFPLHSDICQHQNAHLYNHRVPYTNISYPPSPIHFPSLSTDGVLVAKKDFEIQHDELATKNLYVIKAMQSLTSKGFVKTQFSWQYYYYTLTDEGLDFLREFLGVPEGIVPQTLMEQPIPQRQQNFRREGGRRFDGDNGYRKRNRD